MHQDPVVQPDHSDYCILVTVGVVGDENHGRAVARGNDVSKFLREHKLPHNSGTSQHCRYHKPIVDFGQKVLHY